MNRDGKFGTFAGVYTPSLLTILGVIMYLRLPWVIGNAGVYQGLGIILVAHVISISTGLSISSIATDKAVGAGGPYYIISRSLGLSIGGALGLALSMGLAFSISLYLIGFSESFLSYFGLGATLTNIRICGTLAIATLTVVTFISTEFALKSQYFILALIALSLVSVALGAGDAAQTSPFALGPASTAPALPTLFAIFFPAVTGFTAGVNMSGDLRSPKRSIPSGTMAAIATGFVVYAGLAVFVGLRVPRAQLVEDPDVLLHVAQFPRLVSAGIWSATLSSALGSILGSPRVLQAVAADGIVPRFFARGYGPTQEPRNALLLSFLIGEAGILIGELDVIARIVSMIFLSMYCVLNLSCALESWANPDFRPDFRIPKSISIVGAITSLVVMIQLDLAAMMGALLLMAGLFFYLERKQLRLESGDTWEGFWATLVRAGLHRLTLDVRQERLWKPNVLAFDTGDKTGSDERWNRARRQLAEALAGRTGIVTHVHVSSSLAQRAPAPAASKRPTATPTTPARTPHAGVFHRQLSVSTDSAGDIAEFCRHYGFVGIEPNTVLLHWSDYAADPSQLAQLLAELAALDFNQLVLARGGKRERERKQRIDIWWRDQGGNLPLSLSLARFITSSPGFEAATIRFVLLSQDISNNDVLRAKARRYLARMRVDAEVKVISNALSIKHHEEWVCEESADADLVLWPLPDLVSDADADVLQGAAHSLSELPDVIFVRACSSFEEVLAPGKAATASLLPAAPHAEVASLELPALQLPGPAPLGEYMGRAKRAYERALAGLDEHCLAAVHSRNVELVRGMRSALERQLDALHKNLAGANAQRRRNLLNRFASSFVIDVQATIDTHLRAGLPDQQATLEGRIAAFMDEQAQLLFGPAEGISAVRDPAELLAAASDSPALRRAKRRLRWSTWLWRSPASYRVPVAALERYYFDRAQRELLERLVEQLALESHQLAVQLGKLLCSSRAGITAIIARAMDENTADEQLLDVLKPRALAPFDELIARTKARVGQRRDRLLDDAHALLQQFADDLDRLDVQPVVARERKLPRRAHELHARLAELPQSFTSVSTGLYQRAHVGLLVSAFHQRLAAIVERQKQAAALALRNGALRVCEELQTSLSGLRDGLDSEPLSGLKAPKLVALDEERLDPKVLLSELSEEAEPALRDLPESVSLLPDALVDQLEEGQSGAARDAASVEVPLRSLAQFLVEGELTAGVGAQLESVPTAEARAVSVAREVTRLIAFQLAELEGLSEDEPAARARHMRPALDSSRERLQSEIEQLRQLGERISERFDLQLQQVIERSDPYRLTEAGSQLTQYKRMRQGKSAVSGAQGLVRRAQASWRNAVVALLYRSSAGWLQLRRLRMRHQAEASVIERLRGWVKQHSPQPAILREMPFYYRQVFLGQALNESFWVGREQELAQARRAVQAHREGQTGILLVTGRPGAGKSALCQRIAHKALDPKRVRWVAAPASACADVGAFRAAIVQAAVTQHELDDQLRSWPEQSALCIDDLELWWERSESGLAVIDELLRLVRVHGKRVLFVVSVDHHACVLLDRLRRLSDRCLALVECGPMDARALSSILTLRHGSTGLKLELHGRAEDKLSPLQLARLFARHFSYADGSVGAALRAWVSHIDRVRDQVVSVRAPSSSRSELLDELRGAFRALLIELALHRRLTSTRLAHITLLPLPQVEQQLDTLIRAGLVTRNRHGACEIEPFVRQRLSAHLEHRGLLPA